MSAGNQPSASRPTIVSGHFRESDKRHLDALIAALAANDIDAFVGGETHDPLAGLPVQREQRSQAQRTAFLRFAGRVSYVCRTIEVASYGNNGRRIRAVVATPYSGEPDVELTFSEVGSDTGPKYTPADLRVGPQERPIDPADRAEVDKIVAAIATGDLDEFRQLTPGLRIQWRPPTDTPRRDWDQVYFELFAHKVGRIKHIDYRADRSGQRFITVLLGSRHDDSPDLTLELLARGPASAPVLVARRLLEQGFDEGPIVKEMTAVNRTRTQLPPWKVHPDIPRYSIGWRMGRGEGSALEFMAFFEDLSDEARDRLQQEHPEPEEWKGYYRGLRKRRGQGRDAE